MSGRLINVAVEQTGMALPEQRFFEGAGGWTDGRLGQAYELISRAIDALGPTSDAGTALDGARTLLNRADLHLRRSN